MSRAETIYPLREKLETELEKASRDPINAEIILRYFKVRSLQVSTATLVINFIRLNIISSMLGKRFEDATIRDIEDLVYAINEKHADPSTQNKYRRIIKSFYSWLRGCCKGEYPPEVKWISTNRVPMVKVCPEDLITFEEAIRITESALQLRDKALFQAKLDAGCRIGEILTPKIGEVHFNDEGAVVYSDGKTGYSPIILTWSAKTLAQWLNIHPFRNNKEAPVFCLLDREKPMQLTYSAARVAFMKCVKRSGCTKRVWLHLLKHVSCTEDARRGISQSFRNFKHHWSPNSRMNAVYEHLANSDIPLIQKETWQKFGATTSQKEAESPIVIQLSATCGRCSLENPRDSKFCNRCGTPMDQSELAKNAIAKAKLSAFIDNLADDPEKLEKFVSMIP